MERCEYCGTPFIEGEHLDIGIGFMQVTADEPNCECYEEMECMFCGMPLTKGELKEHFECWDECYDIEVGDE